MNLRTQLQVILPKQIQDANTMKAKALIYSEQQDNKIRFGSQLIARINLPSGNREEKFLLLGPIEAGSIILPKFKTISYTSPLGIALWGSDPTEIISYIMPNNITIYVQARLLHVS